MTPREFRQEQRGVAVAMAGAFILAIAVPGTALVLAGHGAASPFGARLQFALRIDVVVVAWLAAAIANVARLRFFSQSDIAGSSAAARSDDVRIAGAILQNTLEQVVLAVLAHLIVVASFGGSDVIVAALAGLFGVGRFLFWRGYRYGAKGRAFGFAITFYPSVLALLASAVAGVAGAGIG